MGLASRVERDRKAFGQAAALEADGHGAAPTFGSLADVLSGPLGLLAMQSLRVLPRQARSIESVERILSTAADMVFRLKKPGSLGIDKISSVAGVTPQATYRYFKDADELIKTGLRCVVIREHERVIEALSNRVLLDEAEMAKAVVGALLDTCEMLHRFPAHMQENILLEYRQVGYDASLLMSELICKDVDGADIRRTLDGVKVSIALTATIVIATSLSFRPVPIPPREKLEGVLADLFVHVLQSGGSSSGEFLDMESKLDVCLRGATS